MDLQHTDEETSWEDHGFVRILKPGEGEEEATELAFDPSVQHNRNYSNMKKAMTDLATEAMKKASM